MQPSAVELLRVFPVDGHFVIHLPAGRGNELREHLLSHGIRSRVSSLAEAAFDRLELEGDIDPVTVQAILDHWEQ